MRSLLPGSKAAQKVYVPLMDITALPRIDLTQISPEIREKVKLLELGQIPCPTLKVDIHYRLIDAPENIEAWLICKVAQISAVYVVRTQGEFIRAPRVPRPPRRIFLDDVQLDLPQNEQDYILSTPQVEEQTSAEEEEDYPDEPMEEEEF